MRTAIVTGASSGIGAACGRALAAKGFRVCLTARREERLAQLCEEVNSAHGRDHAVYCTGEVTEAPVRQRTLGLAMADGSSVDVLVNSAGFALAGGVEDIDLKATRKQFEVNALAYLAWMQLVGPMMREHGGGRIINIGSVSGLMAFPGLGAYAASKFAVEAISDAARREYRPWGVKVILVEPGPIATEIWDVAQKLSTGLVRDWRESPFRRLYEQQIERARKLAAGEGPPPEIVAKIVCHAACARRPRARYYVPWNARLVKLLAHLPAWLQDWLIGRMIKVR